jgi:hypothetical protein
MSTVIVNMQNVNHIIRISNVMYVYVSVTPSVAKPAICMEIVYKLSPR